MLLLALGVSCGQGSFVPTRDDAAFQNPRLSRGVNVLGYDPIWESSGRGRFKAEHFKAIREGGFDTLRVNLQPFKHMSGAPKFQPSDSWWHTTDWIVSNALSAGLNVVLDLHEHEAFSKDAEGNKDRLLAFWRQVAPHFQDAPSSVLFEILNEPSGQLTPALWNQYLAEALAIIRASNPTRSVIIGPAFWNSIDHLDQLRLPDADRHIIATVHYYTPMEFTHQGAPWAAEYKDLQGVDWQGTPRQQVAIAADFQKAQDWAGKFHRPILLGEFGAYDKGDIASRERYIRCVARTAERLGWSWAYWQFDSDFIVYDISKGQWVEPIHRALVPTNGIAAFRASLR